MKYILGTADWQTAAQGESKCFLLANGLGGYCSQTVIGSNARNDHALLISAEVAPSERWTMVSRLDETLYVNGEAYVLASQSFVTKTQNQTGFHYLKRFALDGLPEWEYLVKGVTVRKRLVLVHGINSLAVRYEIRTCEGQTAKLEVVPVYGIHPKNDRPAVGYPVTCCEIPGNALELYQLSANGKQLYLMTDGAVSQGETAFIPGYYFEQDAADGREGFGSGVTCHQVSSKTAADGEETELTLLYGTDEAWMTKMDAQAASDGLGMPVRRLEREELARQQRIADQSGLRSEAGRQLAVSADAFLTRRDSTNGMSILAGFPFFGDWGRDTMIACYGCTQAIGENDAAKSILRTFMQYCRRGIMPNLFPEGNQEPMYNTVDASLLFINAAWEYLQENPDADFEEEVRKTAETIVCWYACGTDYGIHMDTDHLLAAGSDLWQLTWMDVRFGEILPTPRHGKPVEINAYWYNAVKILEKLEKRAAEKPAAGRPSEEAVPELTAGWNQMCPAARAAELETLGRQIRESFLKKFTRPDGALYDVLPLGDAEPEAAGRQIRCNQVFALSVSFPIPAKQQAQKILGQIRRELYTPVGLRSLSPSDPQYHPHYGGAQFDRDMAYHQGTVWVYPLGDYYRACLRYADNREKEAENIRRELEAVEAAMAEGCLGQLPEIYDGDCPATSKGCYAQAWSTAQLLRVYRELERV